jgi:hypothetical protein
MKRSGRTKKGIPRKGHSGPFPIINSNAAGIDIGSEEHWVAVPEDRDENQVRPFGCFTADLRGEVAESMRCHHGRHGVDGGLLDTRLPDPRSARIRGKARERPPCEERARTKERCLRLSVAPTPPHLWAFVRLLPPKTIRYVSFGLTGGIGRTSSATPPTTSSTCRKLSPK